VKRQVHWQSCKNLVVCSINSKCFLWERERERELWLVKLNQLITQKAIIFIHIYHSKRKTLTHRPRKKKFQIPFLFKSTCWSLIWFQNSNEILASKSNSLIEEQKLKKIVIVDIRDWIKYLAKIEPWSLSSQTHIHNKQLNNQISHAGKTIKQSINYNRLYSLYLYKLPISNSGILST
jgi:hypothetical protein